MASTEAMIIDMDDIFVYPVTRRILFYFIFEIMAFVYHDHEGFRPAKRSKRQRRRRPLPVQDLVLRATEEVEANCDWLSGCRGG